MTYVVLIIELTDVILHRTIKVTENEKHTDYQRGTIIRTFRRTL